MNSFFSWFTIFTTGYGVLLTMALTLSLLVIWDWRLMLAVVIVLQLAVGTLMVTFHNVEPRWMFIQWIVLLFSCATLALSVMQMRSTTLLRRRNNLVMHLLLAPLLIAAWWLLQIDLPLPELNSAARQLFLWLAVVALVQLSIGDDPTSIGVGLLIWCIPLHALAALFTPIPSLLALIGLLELLIGLVCAYLVIADRNPALTPPKQALMVVRDRNRGIKQEATQQPIPVTRGRKQAAETQP
jgi:hypothetical protein